MESSKITLLFITILIIPFSLFGNLKEKDKWENLFKNYPNNKIVIEAFCPGLDYKYDVGEKDVFYHKDENQLVFNKVTIEPSQNMFRDLLGLKITFEDNVGNKIITDKPDQIKNSLSLEKEKKL
jgi:hypothetical protein